MKNYFRIFAFYILLILFFIPTIIFPQNIESLPAFIHSVLVDEISHSATIDSLDKEILKTAIWDSLQNVTSRFDVHFNQGKIVELDIDFRLVGSDIDDPLNYRSIEVTVQLVIDTSEANLHDITQFTRDMPNILLSTTQNRLISSFRVNIDRNVFDTEFEEHQVFKTDNEIDQGNDLFGDDTYQDNRPSVYLVFLNGVFQHYTYNELEDSVFSNKQLTNVLIPNGIVTIGVRSFANNRLTAINIPHSVQLIKSNAFERNRI